VLNTPEFTLRKLTVADLDKDYAAVMSSAEHLRGVFGPGDDWPEGLTRELDLADLGWHEVEFERRTSFTYTVVDPEDSICLGCVYIVKSGIPDHDALCILWVTSNAYGAGLDTKLFAAVQEWMRESWPFENVGYPGRTLSWKRLTTAS
jgi:hypothetical protein